MKIAQITPGVISIPPKGWGAVEKIIWEYTKVLRNLGHEVDIVYTDQVLENPNKWDIVHVHMANLALLLKENNISYVFSHHDHHAYYFGKGSEVYKDNLKAIKGSTLTFVHAKYLIDYFDNLPQIRYLSHGVNIKDYYFEDRSNEVLKDNVSLIMMGNNGLGGDHLIDRKGFIQGIESARKLDLPITIICPKNNNEDFFKNRLQKKYDKLNILYDLDYHESIQELRKHHIFLNLGNLEAGHPNLTVTENIAMGIPVVSLMERDLYGTKKINSLDIEEISNAILDIKNSYSKYILECFENRNLFSWEVIVSKMLMDYVKYNNISQGSLVLDSYNNTKINNIISNNPGYYYWFKKGIHFSKSVNPQGPGNLVVIRDKMRNQVIYTLTTDSNYKSWFTLFDESDKYIDYEILVKIGSNILEKISIEYKDKHVYIKKGKNNIFLRDIDIFLNSHKGIIPTFDQSLYNLYKDDIKCYLKKDIDREDLFYKILNTDQILDYNNRSQIIKKEDSTLILLGSKALGDTISFLPYVEKYAQENNIKCSVNVKLPFLYKDMYPTIDFVNDDYKITNYSDIIRCDYMFNMPLQLGFAKQLNLTKYGKIRPRIINSHKERPIDKKYICFSTHSTSQLKNWNNNNGWKNLCDMLKKYDYIPVCIDQHYSFGIEGHWNEIPDNCINKTGMDIMDIINYIEHCDFFIGLSSGLTWVAHALNKKCVLISGVTTEDNEFEEDVIRIHKKDVCNSCFNNPQKYIFDPGNWMWCPEHENTNRSFECTKRISANYIINEIKKNNWIK